MRKLPNIFFRRKKNDNIIMIRLNRNQALELIASLATQLASKDYNTPRKEFMNVELQINNNISATYFSIVALDTEALSTI